MLIRIFIRSNIIAGAIFKILSRSFYAEILALQGFPAGLRASYFIRDKSGYPEFRDNQPFSTAGRQRGFHDERYLWPEMLRVIRELQPRWVLGENVAGFLRMGLDKTLIDLEQAGYDVRVFVLPAAAVGAWHERKRVFIIGSAASHTPCQRHRGCGQGAGHPNLCKWQLSQDEQGWQSMDGAALSCDLPYNTHHTGKALPQPGLGRVADGFPAQMDGHSLWAKEPADIPRLTEEVPNRSKRMKTLGNAVSPPQVFPILKYIADIETGRCPMGGEEL
ncbi:MAG: DNA cytosine methyltransferase [Gemmiger formicilis]